MKKNTGLLHIYSVMGIWLWSMSLCGCETRAERFVKTAQEFEQTEEIALTEESSISESPEANGSSDVEGSMTENQLLTENPERITLIYVDVEGAVASPGVYELESGSRVFHVLQMAGGVLPEGEITYINQAELLSDGQQIVVPTKEEVLALKEAGQLLAASYYEGSQMSGTASETALINLNTATMDELCTLTGIGEAKAQAILTYREVHGGFQSTEELMQIEGIKQGTFDKIKDRITIE